MLKIFWVYLINHTSHKCVNTKFKTKESRKSRKRHQKLQSNGEMGSCFVCVFSYTTRWHIKELFYFHFIFLLFFSFSYFLLFFRVGSWKSEDTIGVYAYLFDMCDMWEWERYKKNQEQNWKNVNTHNLNVCHSSRQYLDRLIYHLF